MLSLLYHFLAKMCTKKIFPATLRFFQKQLQKHAQKPPQDPETRQETRKGNDFSCIPAGNGLQFIQLTEKAGLK